MADWATISSLATAGGTLALAVTTYASVRSANRAARVAELSLRAGLLPLLVESGESDDTLRVNFYEIHGIAVPGGRAAVEIIDDNLYLVVSLRNVGNGIAVLQAAVSGPSGRAPAPTRRRSTRSACSRGTSTSPPARSASGRPRSVTSRPTSGSCSCPGSSRAT